MANPTWNDITSAPEWSSLTPEDRSVVRNKFYGDVIHPNIPDGVDPVGVQKQFAARTDSSINLPVAPSGLRRAISGTPFGMAIDAMDPNSDSAGGNLVRGVGRGLTTGARGILMAGAGANDLLNSGSGDDQIYRAADALKGAEDKIPQARSTGGRIAQGIGGLGAGFVTAGAGQAGASGQDSIRRGDSLDRAETNLGISGAESVAGVGMGGINKVIAPLAGRIAAQGAAGGALYEGGRRFENAINPDSEHQNFDPVGFGMSVGGALPGAFHSGATKQPLAKGDDLFGSGDTAPVAEDPATHDITAGIPAAMDSYRGHSVLRDSSGAPFAIAPQGGGDVTHLNGRNVDDVIDARQQMVPGNADQPGVVVPNSGRNVPNSGIVDSTATDVTPKQLGGQAQLALPKPSDFEVDSSAQARAVGDQTPFGHGKQDVGDEQLPANSTTTVDGRPANDDFSWLDHDPRTNPEAFGLDKPDGKQQDLLRFIAQQGGLNMDAFKSQFGSDPAITRERGSNQQVVGKPLFKKNGGMSPDDLREAMQQHGWLPPDDPHAPATIGVDDAHDMLSDALMGKSVFHPNDDVAAHESIVQQIETQQQHARAHNALASDVGMSPRGLQAEIDRARASNAQDESIAPPHDEADAQAHDQLEETALHVGADPMDVSKAFFAAKNSADYARKLNDLIQSRKGNGTDEGSAVRPAPENAGAAQVGSQPGDNGGAVNTGNDAGPEAGRAGGVGEAPAASVPASANRSVASRVEPQAGRGMVSGKVREAIVKRYGKAGARLLDSGKIQIHDTADTFPEGAQHLRSDDTLLQAVHDKSKGVTHIAADSVMESNIGGVIMHEVGVHHGMEGLLGNDKMSRLAAQLRVIGQTGKPAEKALIAEALKNANREGAGVRDEELIAHAVEQAEAAHAGGSLTPRLQVWLGDVVSSIKARLYSMGFVKARHLNLNDIRHIAEGALLRASRDNVSTTKTGVDTDGRITSAKQPAEGTVVGPRGKPVGNEGTGSAELRPGTGGEQAVRAEAGSGSDREAGQGDAGVDAGSERAVHEPHANPEDQNLSVHEIDPKDLSNREAYAFHGTDAPAFRKWFDQGKNISQLRDADGNPIRYRHGSAEDLDSFDHGRAGQNGVGLARLGMWATRSADWANHGPNKNEGFVRLKNPVEMTTEELNRAVDKAMERPEVHNENEAVDFVKKQWQDEGHDGIVLTGKDAPHVVLFDANAGSFKRAENNGDFDEKSNFRASRVGVNDDAAADNQKEKESGTPENETFRQTAARKIGEMSHDLFLKVAPQADNRASDTARAVSKDFANTLRMAGHEYDVADKTLRTSLTPEEQKQAWQAANEQSELQQQGLNTKGKGLDTLAPNVRAVVEHEQERSNEALAAAVEAGIFDGTKGDGLPSYVPRMVIKRLASGLAERFGKGQPGTRGDGANVRTSSPQLIARKYLLNKETEAAAKARDADAEVLQNIRTLPLATKKLWEAVAGRKLINSIREVGQAIGQETVAVGGKPNGEDWFTLDHPAFTEYVRATESDPDNAGKLRNKLDEFHDPIYEPRQLFIHKSFEGPLRAIMSQQDGAVYRNLMELKTKTMTGIMVSPAIHLMTEVGRAFPAAPGKFLTGKIWSSGAIALKNEALMHEAVMAGLAPIGGRGGNADVIELANEHNIQPGKSLTAKIIGNTVGLLSKNAGESTKRAIDTAGNFWHEKLLWEQIRKLQAGLYVHFRDAAVADGMSQDSANRIGAHFANRFAGTLPKEATSAIVRKISNLAMFSRTFTMGNWGVMKDALTGLPKDVQAQIMRESGADGLARALSHSKRLAFGTVVLDMGLMYASNSLLQNAAAIYNGSTVEKELSGYAQRFYDLMSKVEKNPIEALNLLGDVSSLTPNSQNESGKQDRILIGHKDDGTAIYVRNPFGKIGEEFTGWIGTPLDMMKRKLSTLARPASEIWSNDKGFGRPLYDKDADTTTEKLANARNIVMQIVGDQVNTSLIKDTTALFNGNSKDTALNVAHLAGDLTGFTISPGFPGGEAASTLAHVKDKQEFKVQEAMPAVREKIKAGDVRGAVQDMTAMGVPIKLQEYYVKTTINPQARLSASQLQKFMLSASPEEKARMMREISQRH